MRRAPSASDTRSWAGARMAACSRLEITVSEMWLSGQRHFTGILRDISVRKRAEDLQRASAAYARSLIEASLDPLVTISTQGKITDVNESSVRRPACRAKTALIGTDFSDYFTEPDKAREGYQRVFSEDLVRDFPLAIRHTTGRIMDVLYNAAVYKDHKGKVQGVCAVARDVTERNRMEQALQETNVELESAKSAAEKANLAKSEYLSCMSHELRGPLNGHLGFAQLMEPIPRPR